MTPRVNTEDLIDALIVAEILELSQRNSVYTYLRRYPDMPRPIVDLGPRRVQLWLRKDIETWAKRRQTRPARRAR